MGPADHRGSWTEHADIERHWPDRFASSERGFQLQKYQVWEIGVFSPHQFVLQKAHGMFCQLVHLCRCAVRVVLRFLPNVERV